MSILYVKTDTATKPISVFSNRFVTVNLKLITVKNVENYTLACLALHNSDNAMYTPRGFIDSESKDGVIKEGEWRSMNPDGEIAFQKLNPVRGSR